MWPSLGYWVFGVVQHESLFSGVPFWGGVKICHFVQGVSFGESFQRGSLFWGVKIVPVLVFFCPRTICVLQGSPFGRIQHLSLVCWQSS